MDVVFEEIDDEDTATTKQHGNGPVHRAQPGHGALGVHVDEWLTQPDSADVERDVPYHHPLFLRRIDTHASSETDMVWDPLIKTVLSHLFVAAFGVPIWIAVLVKAALGRLHVVPHNVTVWLAVHPR